MGARLSWCFGGHRNTAIKAVGQHGAGYVDDGRRDKPAHHERLLVVLGSDVPQSLHGHIRSAVHHAGPLHPPMHPMLGARVAACEGGPDAGGEHRLRHREIGDRAFADQLGKCGELPLGDALVQVPTIESVDGDHQYLRCGGAAGAARRCHARQHEKGPYGGCSSSRLVESFSKVVHEGYHWHVKGGRVVGAERHVCGRLLNVRTPWAPPLIRFTHSCG